MEEAVKILCVDDEKNVLKALRRLFMDDDYDVNIAESGEKGLEIMETESDTQVVISDYRMPGMNGVDFLKQVRERWPDTIRIVLSGYADTASVVAAINEGHIYKFVPKPWDDEELRSTISSAIETYSLQKANRVLASKLQDSNAELQFINERLEQIVEERTSELSFQNRVLQHGQFILDALPVGVLGLDDERMVVQCNKIAAVLFYGADGSPPIGMDGENVLPAEILEFISKIDAEQKYETIMEIKGRSLTIKGVKMIHPGGLAGIILVLI